MALKTDYKDYIPPSGGRKYKITANSDGSSSVEDITQYQQVGDTWGAEDINQVNKLVNGAVYPNLLDNSDFTNPVNQRGSTSYSGGGTYCIDRWDIASTATVAVVSDGIKITATTLSGIRQKIENITDGQLLVFQLCDNADTVYTQAFAASTTQAEYTTDFGKFRFVLNSGGVLTISILLNAGERTFKWAKLEKGSVATPYVPKGYGAELLACQRYYVPIGENTKFFGGIGTAGNVAFVGMILPVQMRVTPSFTSDLNVVLRTVQGEQNIHGPVISKMTENNLAFTITLNSSTTKSTPCAGYFYNKSGLSADL